MHAMAEVLLLLNLYKKQCTLSLSMLHCLKSFYKCHTFRNTMHLYAGCLQVLSVTESDYHNVSSITNFKAFVNLAYDLHVCPFLNLSNHPKENSQKNYLHLLFLCNVFSVSCSISLKMYALSDFSWINHSYNIQSNY